MRVVLGVLLALASLMFALLFVIVGVTKIASGYWFSYVSMFLFAMGAVGCVMAARQCFAPSPRGAAQAVASEHG